MAAHPGKDVLIQVDSGGGTFITVGGMRSKSISLNAETVDISDSDSTNRWRELLGNAGLKSATITGSGVFKDTAGEEDVRGYFFAGTINDFRFVVPDFGRVSGDFQVTSLDYAGEHNGEATFSMTFESAGELTWTAI